MFSKASKFSHLFNGLIVGVATLLCFAAIDRLPEHRPLPKAEFRLTYRPVSLAPAGGALRLAGAWELTAGDPRLGGISALRIDGGRFLAVTDRGAVLWFDLPHAARPTILAVDLREGPGPFDKKSARDAESLARDPQGRGWWVGYEQRHSLWLYDRDFSRSLTRVELRQSNWRDNRGAEGLIAKDGQLLVLGENGRDAIRIGPNGPQPLKLHSDADIAEVAEGPDGSAWVLLRQKSLKGIEQSIAPLLPTHDGYRIGPARRVPKAAFDNFEGMAIAARRGGWRFWLISDDGHRVMARTLLVALDLEIPARHDKSPVHDTGLSKKTSVKTP